MKPGDFVTPINCGDLGIALYESWYDSDSKTIYGLRHKDVALLLETPADEFLGNNKTIECGCKVLLSNGVVGWCNGFYLSSLKV